jgi:hypothetical protein
MKIGFRGTAVLIFAIINIAIASADPGATVSKFMDTPASLFSLGLDKLSNRANAISTSGVFVIDGMTGANYSSGGASFDWDTSRITVFITRFTKPDVEPNKLEDECMTSVKTMRYMAYVPETGILPKETFSDFAQNFFPTGYSLKKLTVDDGKAIDAMITLKIQIFNMANGTKLICTAPLLGTGYSVEK